MYINCPSPCPACSHLEVTTKSTSWALAGSNPERSRCLFWAATSLPGCWEHPETVQAGRRALPSASLLCDRLWDNQDNPILKCHTQSQTWAESFCFLLQNYHLDVPWFAPLSTGHAQTGHQRPSTSLSQDTTPSRAGAASSGLCRGVSPREQFLFFWVLRSLTVSVPTGPTAAYWSYPVCSNSLVLNVDGLLQENLPYALQKYLL